MAWAELSGLKLDMKISETDTRDDARLEQVLAAAVAFVERVHHSRYEFDDPPDPESTLPPPPPDIVLGTYRLAGRWHTRRRSPDAMVEMAELGAARVSSFDPDIDRMLRIGPHAPPVVA